MIVYKEVVGDRERTGFLHDDAKDYLTYNPRHLPVDQRNVPPIFIAWLRFTDDFDVEEYTSMLAAQGYFDA